MNPKTKIALIVSGQTRSFRKLFDNLAQFVATLEKINNADVDVHLFLDNHIELEELQSKVKISSICIENNMNKTESYSYQMHRLHSGYNKITDVNQYEWFVRTRPDVEIISFDTNILNLDKTKVHSRLRMSKQPILNKQNSFPIASRHEKSNINVMDDQFFIFHKDIANKVVSLQRGDIEIEICKVALWAEHVLTYMVNSVGIQVEPLELTSKIWR